ncbi:MAG TPA: 2-oxo acid dehydrogenase subunit E2 [Anaerohalosphaeraceae bacterium]|jgi:pyruvate dehydrogenase E2 component (dihydrolipoamide acetyltransferase)|nr:2-oxo acid dehydrogenase subunit E2 [Anaerohalosphaeraceae bacterium]HRT51929.1 2-oxo acid dehydrogenase subunit E2 [Anaerohalosphaeraceae bacterium]HRT87948.1 2-oxo acid dehydrogenase subunit E2 [Anaerohalosphaeraceae bacterium]
MAGESKNQIPLSRIQKLIGGLMLQSKRSKPYCYLECVADLTELTAFRKPYCKETGLRVTTNDFFFCAMARAVQVYPLMAGQLDPSGDFIRISKHIGVGFAVSAPQGLVVPVIKEVEGKSLAEIAEASDRLLKRARANKLTPDDFHGDTIVLSGLGMYGVHSFLAIAPPGATGILSIGNICDTIRPTDGDMIVRKTMSVSLAVDRRIVDEFYAARFLRYVVSQLEDPVSLTR